MRIIRAPLLPLLGDKKRLLISPDGNLNLIPFDALVDGHGNYLVEQFEISYLTSGRDLLRLQNGIVSHQPMMIFKKSIPRRRFLRGAGTALALPMLDAMFPALASAAQTASRRVTRLSFFEVPNGIIMEKWTPASLGTGFELSPILEPLAAFKDRMLVIGGLANNEAHKLEFEIAGDHPRACSAYLTGTHPKMTSGADIRCGVSVDQVVAREFGKYTQLASLEIGL